MSFFILATLSLLAIAMIAIATSRRRRRGIRARDRTSCHRLPSDPSRGALHRCKTWFYYALVTLRRMRSQTAAAVSRRLRSEPAADLSDSKDGEYAVDSVYVNGFSADGERAVFLRVCRRPAVDKAELWLVVQHEAIGSLRLPVHPHCYVDAPTSDVENGFAAQGLRIDCVEPGRIWKATYSGHLRLDQSGVADETKREVFVRLRLRWSAFTGIFDFETETHPWAIADALARETMNPETREKLEKAEGSQLHWEQWGQLSGTLTVDEEDYELNLRGMRDRSIGRRKWAELTGYCLHFGHLQNGAVFHVAVVSTSNTFGRVVSGYVMKPNGVCEAVTSCTFDLEAFVNAETLPTHYTFTFDTANDEYDVECRVDEDILFLCGARDDRAEIHERKTKFVVNGFAGVGVSEVKVRDDGGKVTGSRKNAPAHLPIIPTSANQMTTSLTMRLTDPRARLTELTGGKGSQLAQLAAMKSPQVTVPDGFCITSASLDKHLEVNADIIDALRDLRNRWNRSGDLRAGYERIETAFANSFIPADVREAVRMEYDALCEGDETTPVAVRSSAVGEDGGTSSAAGQMKTFLNVRGANDVMRCVVDCWASLFSHQAVQYRRQHGWPIVTPMAVVVQRMARAHTAGVLFTADPITGNPKSIVINAARGLGEAVVSGECDPDEIKLERRSATGVSIVSDSNDCCLSSRQITALAHLGLEIENAFGFAVDVEWAECGGSFYVLQARPITALMTETDDELMKELDTALASDSEHLTTCNIGEVSPGASTPLTQSVFLQTIETVLQRMQVQFGVMPASVTPAYKCIGTYFGHSFINLHTLGNTFENNSLFGDKMGCELGLCGRPVHDLTMDMIVSHNGKSSFFRRIMNGFASLCYIMRGSKKLPELQSLLDAQFIEKKRNVRCMYEEIDRLLPVLQKTWGIHMQLSAKSGSLSCILVRILAGQSAKELTAEVLSDVAMLLSTCSNVVSADVPSALEKLAESVINTAGRRMALKFIGLDAESALVWLKSAGNRVSAAFLSFLDKHGHRCLRENELREQPWGTNPLTLVPVLQALIRSLLNKTGDQDGNSAEKTNAVYTAYWVERDCAESRDYDSSIIDSMKTKLSWMNKKLVQFILPQAREAVRQRELGKSLAVKMSDRFREAYNHLGHLLVVEEYLPDADLLFFFTHYEIGRLVAGDRTLVTKAVRRRKIHADQMKLAFLQFNVGRPKPIVKTDETECPRSSLSGLPVSRGVIKGRARVVLNVQEAADIQPGEILITRCTDVGWSPYFPLIAGLVTELGGLLSHGAVVAREYGLPCIAGVPEATFHIQTGDLVLLNATGGTITKLNVS
ncbi:rifampicin phosphotransferase-like isoform X2 [Oscarella lobularis]|uniref:rifampicin phosphotransferase-like isoform X2 n=1 Tax=Oscarella lobularis TaxID=121494 RepID=UPI00331322C7